MENVYPMQPPSRHRSSSNPMRVLCLGLSRSGTDSLRTALLILGFRDVYHGFVITAYQREDCAFWVPLLRRKVADISTELRNVNFDSVLGECAAVTDGPANVFGPGLLQYYPKAQVVLNRRRNIDAWHASMQATCLQVFSPPLWVFSWFDAGLCWLWWNFKLVMSGYYGDDFERNGKRIAREHYGRLEKMLREQEREWLDWGVEDGWEPLCKFLNVPLPDVPFPDGNKGAGQFQMNMANALNDLIHNALRRMGIFVVAVLVAAVGAILAVRL